MGAKLATEKRLSSSLPIIVYLFQLYLLQANTCNKKVNRTALITLSLCSTSQLNACPEQMRLWAKVPGPEGQEWWSQTLPAFCSKHIARIHCWFSFHWALVKGGRIRTLFLLSLSFIYTCYKVRYYQLWLIGSSRIFSAWQSAKKVKSSEGTRLSYLPEICEEVVRVCALWSTHAITLMFLQKTELTVQLIYCQNSNCGYDFPEQMYMLTVVSISNVFQDAHTQQTHVEFLDIW